MFRDTLGINGYKAYLFLVGSFFDNFPVFFGRLIIRRKAMLVLQILQEIDQQAI